MRNWTCCVCGREFEDANSVIFYQWGIGPEETDIVCPGCEEAYEIELHSDDSDLHPAEAINA